MKIVFMGTPDFAVPSLEKLIVAGHDIQLVITQPDKKGNRNKIIPSAVKVLALEKGLDIAQPDRIRKDNELIERLKQLSPDMIIVAAFGQILPQEVLDIPKYGCINVHGSLLPKYRGASPMQAAILDGCNESGVTIMKMEAGLDTGDMISKITCDIQGLNIIEVSDLLSVKGAELLIDTIPKIAEGTATFTKQNDAESPYAGMIKKTDGFTDFCESADLLERKIRSFYEWPNLYTLLGDLSIKFFKAEVVESNNDALPGTVIDVSKDYYTINCKVGALKVLEQQLQGKKRMSAGDFMRGHKLRIGDKFGE